MQILSQTRADARALFSAALAGAAVGLVLGGCYLAGGLASAASRHTTVSRVADATGGALSDVALISAPNADAGVLTLMRRRDPALAYNDQGRQFAALGGRLQESAKSNDNAGAGLLLRASFGGGYNPAAAPFRIAGGLQTSRELECLTQAVYYEARGEGPGGQAAVAQVVLNRVRHPAFPKSVCGVVFQRAGLRSSCQFSFACDGSLRMKQEPAAWARAQRVASRALAGQVMADVGNATHFHTTAVAPPWGPRLMRVAQVGLHVFYRFGGRAGAPGAFNRAPAPSDAADPTMDLVVAGLNSADASATAIVAMAQAAPQMLSADPVGAATSSEPPAVQQGDKSESAVRAQPIAASAPVATAPKGAAS